VHSLRHIELLAEARNTLTDELRGVLIATKANRIKGLDQYHKDCGSELETEIDPTERRQLRHRSVVVLLEPQSSCTRSPRRPSIGTPRATRSAAASRIPNLCMTVQVRDFYSSPPGTAPEAPTRDTAAP
jgi:hypothetical protein